MASVSSGADQMDKVSDHGKQMEQEEERAVGIVGCLWDWPPAWSQWRFRGHSVLGQAEVGDTSLCVSASGLKGLKEEG